MSSMKGKLGMLAMMAAMMGGGANVSDLRPEDIDISPKKRIVPKGCKEYWFNSEGYFTTGMERERPIRKDQVVFYCVASSDKKAREKYERWKSINHQ